MAKKLWRCCSNYLKTILRLFTFTSFFFSFLTLTFLYPSPPSASANSSNVATSSMLFLRAGLDAEAIGLAGSRAALTDNLYAMQWNPGGLGRVNSHQIAFCYSSLFDKINYTLAENKSMDFI
ncbi:MAG: hypothetical protein AB1765_02255 [Candidatus Hydrogenedentota bacterium]